VKKKVKKMKKISGLVLALLGVVGCSTIDNRPIIKWERDTIPPMQYYVWVTKKDALLYCGLTGFPGGGCAPTRLLNAIVPANAREMSTDNLVDSTKVGTKGAVCYIFSTANWIDAIWLKSLYKGDTDSHLLHEKKHCAGFKHQPTNILMGN
jgi:hypothetical protein